MRLGLQLLDKETMITGRRFDRCYPFPLKQLWKHGKSTSLTQDRPPNLMRLQSPTSQAGQMLRGAGGGQGAPEAVVASRQPEEVPAQQEKQKEEKKEEVEGGGGGEGVKD